MKTSPSGVRPPEQALQTVTAMLLATGALARAKKEAAHQAQLAKKALVALPAGSGREALAAVADLAVDRAR